MQKQQWATTQVSTCNRQPLTHIIIHTFHSLKSFYLRTKLIHQLDNPWIAYDSSRHSNEQQHKLASATNNMIACWFCSFSIISTYFLNSFINCTNHGYIWFKQTQQWATIKVSTYNEQTYELKMSHWLYGLNSYWLTT